MQILVTGGTGFIGEALLPALTGAGHEVWVLSREQHPDRERVRYLQDLDTLPAETPIDAVINLAGASLAGRRWNAAYKREIVASRLDTTRSLLELIARLDRAPGVLLNASAIGYYGASDDTPLDESAPPGAGFSAELCQQWEQLARGADVENVRVCLLRLGVVLDAGGGALTEMARPFRLGVANWIGDGRQYLSWVHRSDVVAAMLFLLENAALSGAFNVTAPAPVTSRELCNALKRRLRTLVTLPMPAAVMRLMVGEMADELLISGQRVVPRGLLDAGFSFDYPDIATALEAIEGKHA